MNYLSRRRFLQGAAGAAAFSLSGRQVLGANEDLRAAVIGFNGRGMNHIDGLLAIKGVRLVALCDVDPAVLARGLAYTEKKGAKCEGYKDVRALMDARDIDIITTATPNHWHSLIGIWACQTGRDSYIEKPVSHNVWEGRQLVKAARKYKKVVAGGTQSRSNGNIAAARDWLHAGNLGKIEYALGTCYKPRMSIGNSGAGTIPAGLDYDHWTGPAALQPLTRANLHYDWHWVHNTGNGDMGNQGIHQMDIARWLLGQQQLAPRVMSVGGRFGYQDDGETPNTQIVYQDYEPAPLIFETRGLPRSREFHDAKLWGSNMDRPDGYTKNTGIGVIVFCEGGRLVATGGGDSVQALDKEGKLIREFKGAPPVDHMANFVEAVRARKPGMLKADVLETHLSSALCHTGMISHHLGKERRPEEILESIRSDGLAAERFEAMREHLSRNGVSISSRPAVLGPWLTLDPKSERFKDDERANSLLGRVYRPGYEVPEKL